MAAPNSLHVTAQRTATTPLARAAASTLSNKRTTIVFHDA